MDFYEKLNYCLKVNVSQYVRQILHLMLRETVDILIMQLLGTYTLGITRTFKNILS